MATTESFCCQDRATLCDWCTRFKKQPHRISTAEKNTRMGIGVAFEVKHDPISYFMRDPEEPENCSSRAILVRDICGGDNSLEQQESNQLDLCKELQPVALIYDIYTDGNTTKYQPHQRALNALELFRYLAGMETYDSEVNFRGHYEVQRSLDSQVQDSSFQKETAHRRLIFVDNLDYSTILAFVRTASEAQAWALRDCIYNHLANKASINATMSQVSLWTFRLAMDLPFYALRQSAVPLLDRARAANGDALRQCEDLGFLSAHPCKAEKRYFLCEAHFSCVISGTHDSRWEGHAFNDTYINYEEAIEEYEFDPEVPEQMLGDPIRAGKAADQPFKDPRVYFLDVFAIRIKRIRGEWREVLDYVDHQIKYSVSRWKE